MNQVYIFSESQFLSLQEKLDSILSQLPGSTTSDKKWLTSNEVKDMLGVKETTLWNLRQRGKVTWSKPNGKVFYLRSSVLEYLNQNKVEKYDQCY